jgi:hypothetical protein
MTIIKDRGLPQRIMTYWRNVFGFQFSYMHVMCYYIKNIFSQITMTSIFQTFDPEAVAEGQKRMKQLFKE